MPGFSDSSWTQMIKSALRVLGVMAALAGQTQGAGGTVLSALDTPALDPAGRPLMLRTQPQPTAKLLAGRELGPIRADLAQVELGMPFCACPAALAPRAGRPGGSALFSFKAGHGTVRRLDTAYDTGGRGGVFREKLDGDLVQPKEKSTNPSVLRTTDFESYRLENWKLLRAPFRPYFLRSFMRPSRVR